jgi:membrane protease YdiL (CAAX protease family)
MRVRRGSESVQHSVALEEPEQPCKGVGADPAKSQSLELFALVCFGVWALGAWAVRWIGIWPGVGGAALILGMFSLGLHRHLLAELLQPSRRLVLWGLAAAMVMLPATYLLYGPAGLLPYHIPTQTQQLYTRFRDADGLLTTIMLPLCVVAEELVWRGVVQEAVTRRFGAAPAVVLAASAYAVAHWPVGSPLLPVIALACGLFWGLLRATTRSLVPALICHMLWDVIVFTLVPLVR